MADTPMYKKIAILMIYVAEWILFFYVFLFVFIFNWANLLNVITVDMPWEEPIALTSSFSLSLLLVLGIGLVCSLYIKFLIGSRGYKRFKKIVWGSLFGLNGFSCLFYLLKVYGAKLTSVDSFLLLIVAIISIALTIQVIKKQDHVTT